MKIIGLTGQTGAGKGAVDAILEKYGIPSVDTDAVYHEILDTGGDCVKELVATFGTKILGADGKVDRATLAKTVFGKKETPALLHTLNGITHKYIMSETKKRLVAFEKAGAYAAVIDAPLLFEAKIDEWCDLVLGVLADKEIRISRIMARDHIRREDAVKRVNSQRDDRFFREHCHFVLENNGSMEELETQVRNFLARLRGE